MRRQPVEVGAYPVEHTRAVAGDTIRSLQPARFKLSGDRDSHAIQTGQLVSPGYGKYARSDDVEAVEPITEERGPGRRSLVWVNGITEPLVASRAEASVIDDLVTPAEEAARMRELRATLESIVVALDRVPSLMWRVTEEETGTDVKHLVKDARRVLA